MTNKKAISIGPHWQGGETPINVGSYTNIKPVINERCGTAPCRLACPVMTDIEGFITLATSGEYEEALKLIKEANPLPLVTGRVCVSFCETRCRRGAADEPLAIRLLERFVADYDQCSPSPYVSEVKAATGHKVAIIGGGPAGLSAAYFLAIQGHSITIFDKNEQLGGMLRYPRIPPTKEGS
jgi:formate dehydrogenase major subunit